MFEKGEWKPVQFWPIQWGLAWLDQHEFWRMDSQHAWNDPAVSGMPREIKGMPVDHQNWQINGPENGTPCCGQSPDPESFYPAGFVSNLQGEFLSGEYASEFAWTIWRLLLRCQLRGWQLLCGVWYQRRSNVKGVFKEGCMRLQTSTKVHRRDS